MLSFVHVDQVIFLKEKIAQQKGAEYCVENQKLIYAGVLIRAKYNTIINYQYNAILLYMVIIYNIIWAIHWYQL